MYHIGNMEMHLINTKIVQLIFSFLYMRVYIIKAPFVSVGFGFFVRKCNLQHTFFIFKYNIPLEKTEIFAYLFNIVHQ